MKKKIPVPDWLTHPGVVLREDFLSGKNMTVYRLAQLTKFPASGWHEIVNERRAITVKTAIKLSVTFNTTAEFWMNLQTDFDLGMERMRLQHEREKKKARR